MARHPLTDENGDEIPVYDEDRGVIRRRDLVYDPHDPCGVLMNLTNIRALFRTADDHDDSDNELFGEPPKEEKLDVYPLGFLRKAGNVQAGGAPHCFLAPIKKVNRAVRKEGTQQRTRATTRFEEDSSSSSTETQDIVNRIPTVKATSCQFYNYIAHRIAPHAGKLDSQQGLVTAALVGAFAQTIPHENTARIKQAACKMSLPAATFLRRIYRPGCPTCCRAEIVYLVDISNLKSQDGRYVDPSFIHVPRLTHPKRDIQEDYCTAIKGTERT